MRAVLGARVQRLLENYRQAVNSFAPESAFDDAAEHLPQVLLKRATRTPSNRADAAELHALVAARLALIGESVRLLPYSTYEGLRLDACARLAARDEDDWPVLACALVLECPIWTEDQDFFGVGVPTWTTSRVEIFLKAALA